MCFGVTTISSFACCLSSLACFSFFTSSSSSFGRDDSRLLDARDARFSSVTSVSKLLALLLLLLLLLFVACALKKCRRRFDDASGVRKVNKTLALQASLSLEHEKYRRGVHKITRKGFLTVRSRHNRRASRSRRKKMGAFREAFIVARLFDGTVCERIFGQLSVHGKEVENTTSRFSSARCFVRHVCVAMEQLELKIHTTRNTRRHGLCF